MIFSKKGENFGKKQQIMAQVAPDVPRDKKILQPGDYLSGVDHYRGDWKTMVRKSKSLVPGF